MDVPEEGSGHASRPQRATGRRERKRQEIRAALVEAATQLFAEVGYDAARTDEIARRANVAQATLFRHFPTKAALALVHLRDVVDALVVDLESRPATESAYTAIVNVVGRPETLARLDGPSIRIEGARIADHPDLIAHVYWMVSDVRQRLAAELGRRAAVDADSARARVMAGVVIECAIFTMEDSFGRGDDHVPVATFRDALEVMRPLLDETPLDPDVET